MSIVDLPVQLNLPVLLQTAMPAIYQIAQFVPRATPTSLFPQMQNPVLLPSHARNQDKSLTVLPANATVASLIMELPVLHVHPTVLPALHQVYVVLAPANIIFQVGFVLPVLKTVQPAPVLRYVPYVVVDFL